MTRSLEKVTGVYAVKRLLDTVKEEAFVVATAFAAFIHSTWALAILFNGALPDWRTQPVEYLGAIIPAALLAFSIDVGQIITSHDLRHGRRNAGKRLTFAALAFATYYLQWIYMIAHVPDVPLGAGVREEWQSIVALVRDLSVWFVPALLPLATLLYTISNAESEMQMHGAGKTHTTHAFYAPKTHDIAPSASLHSATTHLDARSRQNGTGETAWLAHAIRKNAANGMYIGVCPECGFQTSGKVSPRAAKAALAAHSRKCISRMQPKTRA